MRVVDLLVRVAARRSRARSRLLAYRVLQSIVDDERDHAPVASRRGRAGPRVS